MSVPCGYRCGLASAQPVQDSYAKTLTCLLCLLFIPQGSETDGKRQETTELLLLEWTCRCKWPKLRDSMPHHGTGKEASTGHKGCLWRDSHSVPPPTHTHSFWCTYGHLSFSAQAPSADSGHRKRLASTPAAGKRVDKRADKGNSLGFLEDPMLRRGELVGL